jgi:hypothetical protein
VRLTGSFEGSGVTEAMRRRPLLERLQLRFWVPLLLLASSPAWLAHLLWRGTPPATERVLLVDYTVPFVSAREHRGTVWLLNHGKFAAPSGDRWETLGSHVGYDPRNRTQQTAIHELDLSTTDWVLVADAYGVYVDDLRDVEREQGHMDYSPRLFGGLSVEDSEALRAFTDSGGHVLLEFNALEEPTPPAAGAPHGCGRVRLGDGLQLHVARPLVDRADLRRRGRTSPPGTPWCSRSTAEQLHAQRRHPLAHAATRGVELGHRALRARCRARRP